MSWGEVLKHNGWQALVLLSQALGIIASTIFKEKGYADFCLSATAYRWEQDSVRSWPRVWIDRLFGWQPEHCKASFDSELAGMHLPEVYRKKREDDGL